MSPVKKPLGILLVEDSPGDIRLIQEMLRGLPEPGCTLTCRNRLSEAQSFLQADRPEVILMDLGLPDAQDLEAMEGIRGLAHGIPVVVLTGLDDERLAHRALEQGAQDYLVKGRFDASMLLRALRYAMDRQRREAALRANLVGTFLRCVVGEEEDSRPEEQEERESRLRQVADQLQTLSRQLVDVQEHERYTLSRELHDRVGQNLTALALDLDLMGRQLDEGALPALRDRLREARKVVRATAEGVSDLLAELRPQMLDEYGLGPALEWQAAQWTRRTGIPVRVRVRTAPERLAAPVEIGLFRIAQEALTNIAKHAQATRVWILLARVGSRSRLIVADDGRGLPAEPGQPRPGHGLLIMRERAKSLHGRFHARSRRLGGTCVLVELGEPAPKSLEAP